MSSEHQTFEDAAEANRASFLGEFIGLVMENKKWWLLPILVLFLGIALLVALGSTGAAPFIYTLF
jgi:hypothetical protein